MLRTPCRILVMALMWQIGPAVAGDPNAGKMYSAAQAARGEVLYAQHCAQCHGARLEGASAVPLSGVAFAQRWQDPGLTVDDLFYIVRTLMPYSAPASLGGQEYLDIIVHLLEVNGYPPGERELPLDPAVLKGLVLSPAR